MKMENICGRGRKMEEDARRHTLESIKNIIAAGFDVNKTSLFHDMTYTALNLYQKLSSSILFNPGFYENTLEAQSLVTFNLVKSIVDFSDSG